MSEQGGAGWQAGPSADGRSGCVKLLLVIVVLAVGAVIGLALLAGNFLNNFTGGGNGSGGGDVIGGDCPYLSDADAAAVLGGNPDVIALEGLYDVSIGIIIDKRVLTEAPDCFVTDGSKAYLARVAVQDAGDAAAVFESERERAAPSSQDQGGVSGESPGYFGGEVAGIGDAAFCTGLSDAIMAGVLVRQGDRLVYVSVGGPSDGEQVPDMESTPDGVVISPGLCELAQDVARVVLD